MNPESDSFRNLQSLVAQQRERALREGYEKQYRRDAGIIDASVALTAEQRSTVFETIGEYSESEKSISRSPSPIDVVPTLDTTVQWHIPGRGDDRVYRSSVGDIIVSREWRQRLTADASQHPRYHVRKEGAAFGEPLAPRWDPKFAEEPRYQLPPPPAPDQVDIDLFRLQCFYSDVNPERVVDAAEVEALIADDEWFQRPPGTFWRGLYREHWEAMEDRTVAAPSLDWQKRRLATRLCVAGSIFDGAFRHNMFDTRVESCNCTEAVRNLWRQTLRIYGVLPDGVETDIPLPAQHLPQPEVITVSMELEVTVHISGLDLTVIFAADRAQLSALQRALESDVHDALRPGRKSAGYKFFDVKAQRLEHGALLRCLIRAGKSRAEIEAFEARLQGHIEDGTFALRTTRDVLLNVFAHPPYAVKVIGAALRGGVVIPEGFMDSIGAPAPFSPLVLDFMDYSLSYSGQVTDAAAAARSGSEADHKPSYPAPRTFLETVWQEQPVWERDAANLPPYGSELPRRMHVPSLREGGGNVRPDPSSPWRSRDGSVMSPALSQFFKRRAPLED